jgi:Crp-like helix-turn-helix domain
VRLFQSGGRLAGVLDESVRAVGRAHDAASQAGDSRLLQIIELQRDELNSFLRPDTFDEPRAQVLDEQLAAFVAAGDDEGIVAAASAKMAYLNLLARREAMVPLVELLRGVSARLHDPNLARWLLIAEADIMVYGSRPASEAMARLQQMQEETSERWLRANLQLNTVPLLAMSLALVSVYREDSDPVVLPLTQDDIAGLVGARRPTINTILNRLADEGAVRLSRGKVTVLDPARLLAQASSG